MKTGSEIFNSFLKGGYEKDIITSIYGPAGSAKTLMCILAAIQCVRDGKKVIYIDSEGGFSVERLKQIDEDYKLILNHIIFLKPTTFEEQKEVFGKLKELVTNDIGLVIVDTISMLYRIELGKSDKVYQPNKELGVQISYLAEIARKKKIPVILTNQVYADFEAKNRVKMVGGDLLKYQTKCLIEMRKDENKRKAILIKHRSIKDGKEIEFEIVEKGLKSV